MDRQTRRELKRLGKAAVEAESEAVRQFCEDLNPVSIDHPEWAKNEIILRQRERELRQHRRVVPAAEIRAGHFVVEPLEFVSRPKDFLVCLRCGDCVPALAQVSLECGCAHLRVDPARRPVHNTTDDVALARLTPALPKRPWWRFWG